MMVVPISRVVDKTVMPKASVKRIGDRHDASMRFSNKLT